MAKTELTVEKTKQDIIGKRQPRNIARGMNDVEYVPMDGKAWYPKINKKYLSARLRKAYSPDEIMEQFDAYVEDLKAHPMRKQTLTRKKTKARQQGIEVGDTDTTQEEKNYYYRPPRITDFVTRWLHKDMEWWRNIENGVGGEDYRRVKAYIKEYSKNIMLDGATMGIYNANIVSRELGLAEKIDVNNSTNNTQVVLSQEEAMKQLYMPFGVNYQQFFWSTRNDRHVLLQGGRRSGKTQATIRHLMRLCDKMGESVKIMVVCYQRPQLEKTIEDWKIATGQEVRADEGHTHNATWQFCNFDDYTKAQGSQCDYLFLNEAVNMPEEIADVLILGCRKQVIYNYNPTKSCWVQKHIAEDGHNLICTTFKDNPYLPAEQIEEFEQMKVRAERKNASTHDKYMYEVYYKGNFATMVGAVFNNLSTTDEYESVPAMEFFGLDFGFAVDGDPTVCVGVKIWQGAVYVKQYVYEQGLTTEQAIERRLRGAGVNEYCEIHADYGGMGRQKIVNMREHGWDISNCIKTERLEGISRLLAYETIYIDSKSVETRQEFESLELDENFKTKGADHSFDAVRYAFISAERFVR